jgi:hypothetical protein
MNTSVPRLTLVARDGARLRTCEVQESTHQPGQAPSWEVCGQTPAQLDPEGTFLCPAHFRRLAQCGGCGTVGVQGTTLTWHATADCMLCGACWFEDNE